MSKIFEALQRSESERSGTPFLEEASLATEFLQSAQTATAFGQYRRLSPSLGPGSRIVCLADPTNLAAEKFRLLSIRIRNLAMKREMKRILVTSALPAEGKSVCAANLAVSLSRNKQKRTLLIEGDLRRPNIRQALGLLPIPGLSEWLQGDLDLNDVIYQLDQSALWFLPAGTPTNNPLELMQPTKLSELFEQISEMFDWIVLDSTPVVPLADTTLWTRYADGVLLVTREGTTEKRPLRKTLEILGSSKLVGVVLNGCTNNNYGRYYQYYSPAHPKAARKGPEAAS